MTTISNIKSIIDTLNFLNTDKTPLPTSYEDLEIYLLGLEFISDTFFKILLICKTSKIDYDDKIALIMEIPDPDGDQFIDEDLAIWIYSQVPNLKLFYEKPKYTLKGGAETSDIKSIIGSPLKTAEESLGPLATIPLEIFTMLIGTMGSISSLIGSSASSLPMPPPLPDLIGKTMLGVQVFSNSFNVFLNIARANWDMVVQSAMGIFPQILVATNGLSQQLKNMDKLINTFNGLTSGMITNSNLIMPMLKPIADNPISFLNPIKFNVYLYTALKKLKDEILTKQIAQAKAKAQQKKADLANKAKTKMGDKVKSGKDGVVDKASKKGKGKGKGKGNKDTKDGKGNKDTKDGKGNKDTKDGKGNKDTKEEKGDGDKDTKEEKSDGDKDTKEEKSDGDKDIKEGKSDGDKDIKEGKGKADKDTKEGKADKTAKKK